MRGSIIYLIIIIALCGGLFYLYNELRIQRELSEMHEQNTVALKDTMFVMKNKIGVLEYSKASYSTTVEGLIKLNKNLKKELDNTNGKVHYLNKALLKYEGGTQVSSNDSIIGYDDDVFGVQWVFRKQQDANNYRYLKGISKFSVDFNTKEVKPLNTTLMRDYFVFTLSSGLRTRNDVIESFMSIPLEGVSIEDINGVIIKGKRNPISTKTSKHTLSLGAYIGYGLGYDFSKNDWFDGAQTGIGFNYRINLF
jgi:hypothetical protein